jgi:endoplasmic reticulum junction formation protein lunapark
LPQCHARALTQSTEKALIKLKKEKREKIEEFKKKNAYYETRNLLEKYDVVPTTPQSALRFRPQGPPGSAQLMPQITPQQRPSTNTGDKLIPNSPNNPFAPGAPPTQQPAFAPTGPFQRQWYDKITDAILGDDPASSNPAQSRYALVCGKCFAHNGLAKEDEWDTIRTCIELSPSCSCS